MANFYFLVRIKTFNSSRVMIYACGLFCCPIFQARDWEIFIKYAQTFEEKQNKSVSAFKSRGVLLAGR
jgi:hypothetical protein